MRVLLVRSRPVAITAALVAIVLGVTLHPYDGNVSALFHMDAERAANYQVPAGFVVLDVPGYDGMQYYHIAKTIPGLFSAEERPALTASDAMSYSYQRFLLPLTAFIASFGSAEALPWVFLLINALSLVGVAALMIRWKKDMPLHAIALAICPAAMVGLHFDLAEPLTLLIVTAIIIRRISGKPLDALTVILACLVVLAREVNVFFVLFLMGHAVLTRKWKEAAWLVLPVLMFIAWHGVIYQLFGTLPFLWSTEKRSLPFQAMLLIATGGKGWNALTYSSIVLMALFFVPALALTLRALIRKPFDFLALGALGFLIIMSMMREDIWGSMTSVGRVITPVYPFTLMLAARDKTKLGMILAAGTLIAGLAIAAGLASSVHPYHLS